MSITQQAHQAAVAVTGVDRAEAMSQIQDLLAVIARYDAAYAAAIDLLASRDLADQPPYTVKETAEALHVSVWRVRELIASKQLPVIPGLGTKKLIRREDVARFLANT